MNAEMQWLLSDEDRSAHLCVINRDGGKVKVAAVCNNRARLTWRTGATPESPRCVTCVNMEASEKAIVFVMPDTGNRITVREARSR